MITERLSLAPRGWANLAMGALALLAAGHVRAEEAQDREDYFGGYTHRIDGVSVGGGDASASNAVAQMINPWPGYARNRHILSDSQRMIGAIRRYHTNSSAKPMSMHKPVTTGAGAQAAEAATPDIVTPPSSNGSAGE